MNRINAGLIDLQPEFQRGEVWSLGKKQRLIDSILRRWHVPPIHLVLRHDSGLDVLDGQQRLSAIRDFVNGKFAVDGNLEPIDESIQALDRLRYHDLPDLVRRRFDAFSVRIFELHDYAPGEPHELFFRLNQPTNLTEAEKRNALIGNTRNQVRELVRWAQDVGLRPERVGFSNARLSYDDVLARFLLTLEQRALTEKITAQRITDRYRAERAFSEPVIDRAKASLEMVLSLPTFDQGTTKPNKATFHTWLCVSARLAAEGVPAARAFTLVSGTFELMEVARTWKGFASDRTEGQVLAVYADRASSRVADATSVVLRDVCSFMMLERAADEMPEAPLAAAKEAWTWLNGDDPEGSLLRFCEASGWGEPGWI
jgi:hypothetical protein